MHLDYTLGFQVRTCLYSSDGILISQKQEGIQAHSALITAKREDLEGPTVCDFCRARRHMTPNQSIPTNEDETEDEEDVEDDGGIEDGSDVKDEDDTVHGGDTMGGDNTEDK